MNNYKPDLHQMIRFSLILNLCRFQEETNFTHGKKYEDRN